MGFEIRLAKPQHRNKPAAILEFFAYHEISQMTNPSRNLA
jgi:hypothetical protein